MTYISCNNLSIGYEGKVIIENLNFHVNKGDYLCIIGENGTGKSTLIKTILNLQNPKSGNISLGEGLKKYDIGYLPQQTMIQDDFPATVWEIVLSGTLSKCGKRFFYGKKEKALAKENIKKMGLENMIKSSYRKLSGGQKQRVLLARALCATTKVVLLDEPVAGLDPKVTSELYNIINDINKEKISVIMVSHDMKAIEYASHVLMLYENGYYYGEKDDFLNKYKYDSHMNKGGRY